jgi:hypothetical protein
MTRANLLYILARNALSDKELLRARPAGVRGSILRRRRGAEDARYDGKQYKQDEGHMPTILTTFSTNRSAHRPFRLVRNKNVSSTKQRIMAKRQFHAPRVGNAGGGLTC